MSCGVGRRHSSDPVLLWLWCRPVATPLVRSLAWELPYAVGEALKKKTKKKKKNDPFNKLFKYAKRIVNSRHEVIQQLSRTYSSYITGTLCPMNSKSSFPPPPASGNHHSTFCFYEFGLTDISISSFVKRPMFINSYALPRWELCHNLRK